MTDVFRNLLDETNKISANAVSRMRKQAARWRLESTTLPPKEANDLWQKAVELDAMADEMEGRGR